MREFWSAPLVMVVAAVVAGVTWLLIAMPGRVAVSPRTRIAWIVSLAAGIYAGCALLNQWPRWPPREDRERLLTVLLPLASVVDAALLRVTARTARPWLAWILRLAMAASITPILLFRTSYLADLAGPGSAEWSMLEAALRLSAIAAIVALVWALLAKWQVRTTDATLAAVLAITTFAAGATVLLSGYLYGGLIGLAWGGALAGTAAAPLWSGKPEQSGQFMAVAMLGLGGVLVMGGYLGALPLPSALVILIAPLAVWIAELPVLPQLSPRLRFTLQLILVSLPLIVIMLVAAVNFLNSVSLDDLVPS